APGVALARRLAGVLPPDVVVHRAGEAPAGFDARFSALRRRYAYRLADDPRVVDPLRRDHVLRHRLPLDAEAMDRAAQPLVGQHDFAAFCRRRPGADAGLVVLDVMADAFCHSMVRSLVGALLAVGEGRRPESWPAELLTSGRRGVLVAPAAGLTLEEVEYPPDSELASRASTTRARRTEEARALRVEASQEMT
ncbi:tRNA pseudouridine(38-40) synthase TruA, partial [Actinotalea sp. C106]|uniref:tRNA pseudouridine synthase A n=1 Tax=Actinotalea sp. C106 TaxID=2908644 RepID=UPI0035AC2835